ncbi:U3 small nucleolar RNA-associated protein NOL7 isoform X1 [Antennarius striatus]|uniref:U3 small nucleolar RNA-associated protein NOL7 isoform X1 n=1 Tax=Antennarius striatus TaxID=241820 RepID=UPI0035B3D601
MAEKQRGEMCSLALTEEQTGSLRVGTDSSDEEPEEVPFGEARERALRGVKEALDAARREKEELKEKRRRRQELFQEQKRRKVFPADALEEVESTKQDGPQDEGKDVSPSPAVVQTFGGRVSVGLLSPGEEEENGGRKKKLRKRKGTDTRTVNGHYTVKVRGRGSASVQQQAAQDFIQARLYGPGNCRTTNNQLLSLNNKKGSDRGAAVEFIRKDWACKQKAKAEKLKRRWLHRQEAS